jgi:hypothetical protein
MAEYKQKTKTIQAVQWTGDNFDECVKFIGGDNNPTIRECDNSFIFGGGCSKVCWILGWIVKDDDYSIRTMRDNNHFFEEYEKVEK